jgi:outer membrane receptor protein involved in Fe transport
VRRLVPVFIPAILLIVLGAAAARAQATGGLTGQLTDASGSALPGVTVEVVSEATAQTRTATTGDDGFYTFPLVTPGRYAITATLSGFKTAKRDGVVVAVNDTSRVDLRLEVGQVTESVTVSVQPPLVETAHATMGVVIDQAKVVDLPLNGRNFTQLGTLIPGVVAPPAGLGGQTGDATPGGFGNATGGFNVNGMRNQSNNFLLDGASNNDTFNTGFVLRPPPDAIQEFKIMTHSYGAEYGRNAGSVVNVVTRGGSNEWHGAAWEFNRDDKFEARNYFALTKPELKQNQYGGSLGGPIVKNRLFAFGYYEGYKNTRGTTDTRVVLSEAQRAGNFGGATIRDPQTVSTQNPNGLPFPNNTIPAERINPVAARLLADYIPLPNTAGNRYTQSPNVEDDRHQLGVRGDFRHTDNHSLLGRVLYSKTDRFDPLGGSNFSPAGNTATATLSDFMGSDTLMIRSNMINVARVAYSRIDANPNVTSGVDPRDLGWVITPSNPQALGLPNVMINGFFSAGDAQQPFAHRLNEVLSFTDDFSWVSGRHSYKFGLEVRRDHIVLAYINRPNGNFTFNGQYTGNAAADFLLGFPQQYRQATGDPNMDGSTLTTSLYAQDEWRVSSRLTLNAGLRYELSSPFVEKDDKLNAFHPGQQSTRFPAAPTGLVYPGDQGVPRGTYESDRNNFAPRFGLAWDPRGDGRTSVRAAWGLFFDTLAAQGDFFQNGTLAPPFQPLTEVNYSPVSTTPSFTNPLAGVGGGAAFPPGLIFIGWGRDFETPVVQHYNVSVQQQLGTRFGVELGYVGSRGKNLPIFMEINPTTPLLTPAPARPGPRLYPAFSLVRPTFSEAKSWYDSLQASAKLLPWNRFNFLASYTWSHAIDHVSGLNIGGESRPMLPVTIGDEASLETALGREKGDALFDARHRFVVSFGYELPLLESKSALVKYTLGGWQVNGIVQAQSGFALTVTESVDIALQSLTNRPNQTCDPNDGAPNTVAQWFNTNCFSRLTLAANAGQVGDAGRGTVRGPGFARTDLSLFKNFDFAGRQRIQVRVEAFNLFDQTRFGNPGLSVGTPSTFGIITSADDGRIVQLGIKYQF